MKKVPVSNETELFEKFIKGEFDFVFTTKENLVRYVNYEDTYTMLISKRQGYIIFPKLKNPQRASRLKSIFDYNYKPSK